MKYFLEKPKYNCKKWEEILTIIPDDQKKLYQYPLIPNEAYVKISEKIAIQCSKHGEFLQVLRSHILGHGCFKCVSDENRLRFSHNKEKFIEKAIKIHDAKYDYSDSIYINDRSKIKIKCNKCKNIFEQSVNAHLRGQGCRICSTFKITFKNRERFKEFFIKRAREIHGEKYDYSEIEYLGKKIAIKIFCKKCQKYFNQVPANHLNKSGCIRCGKCRRGPENPCWKSDIPLEDRINKRGSVRNLQYEEWRNLVYKRDNYICQITGLRGKMEAHHIFSWNKYRDLRFDINNGITIIKEIHKLFHIIYGRGNNTKEQFEEFTKYIKDYLCI